MASSALGSILAEISSSRRRQADAATRWQRKSSKLLNMLVVASRMQSDRARPMSAPTKETPSQGPLPVPNRVDDAQGIAACVPNHCDPDASKFSKEWYPCSADIAHRQNGPSALCPSKSGVPCIFYVSVMGGVSQGPASLKPIEWATRQLCCLYICQTRLQISYLSNQFLQCNCIQHRY